MPEDTATAVEAPQTSSPDSSPASTEASPEIQIPRDGAAYQKWRLTGELPGQKPKGDSTPPKDSEKPSAPEAEKPEVKTQPQRQAGADERLREILADLKEAGLTPKELKTYKRQAEAERRPESRPEPRQEAAPPPAPKGLEAPKKPKYDEFKDWEAYEAAKDQYTEALADYKVQLAINKDRAERAQMEAQRTWQTKLAEASERYGAEASDAIVTTARAISADQNIHPAVKAVMDDSPVLTDLLYVVGSNETSMRELMDLGRLNPGQAIRKIVLLEKLVVEELQKSKGTPATATPERGEDGKFQAAAPPAKKIAAAPPPPKEVNGRAGPPPDEVERAIEKQDFSSFKEAQNRKHIAQLKGL